MSRAASLSKSSFGHASGSTLQMPSRSPVSALDGASPSSASPSPSAPSAPASPPASPSAASPPEGPSAGGRPSLPACSYPSVRRARRAGTDRLLQRPEAQCGPSSYFFRFPQGTAYSGADSVTLQTECNLLELKEKMANLNYRATISRQI